MLMNIRSSTEIKINLDGQQTLLRDVEMIARPPKRFMSQIVVHTVFSLALTHLPGHGVILYFSGHEKDDELCRVNIFSDSSPHVQIDMLELQREHYWYCVVPSDRISSPYSIVFALATI